MDRTVGLRVDRTGFRLAHFLAHLTHVRYFHYVVSVVIDETLILFSETIRPTRIKLSRNIYWMVVYKVYVFC